MHVTLQLFLIKVLLLLQLTSAVPDGKPRDTKIMGGTDTQIILLSYQVSVRLVGLESQEVGRGHHCGGTALTKRLVLTAGNCIWDAKNKIYRWKEEFVLVMGTTYLSYTRFPTKNYNVEEIVVHPKFTADPITNDLALMITSRQIHTQYTPIGTLPINTKPVAEGQYCTISGWGRTKQDGPIPNGLKSAVVQVLSVAECQKHYDQFIPSMLCAGSLEPDIKPMEGDSGGPLQCNHILVGVSSYNKGPEEEAPTIYSDVYYYRGWIREVNDTIDYGGIGTLKAFPVICLIVLAMILT